MTRLVGVRAPRQPDDLALAMLEDVADLVADMAEVSPALLVPAGADPSVRTVSWPGTPTIEFPDGATVTALLAALAAAQLCDEVAVVAPDAPDLPVLLLGKLHSALTAAEVAVCPADDGRLVAVAVRVPIPDWLAVLPSLDAPGAVDLLRAAAPARALFVGPGWHRVRSRTDAARLDRGLEGWAATRALLDRSAG